jgi:beta-phosphoglucomutase
VRLGAVIFDMDGVLVDSWSAHLESWQAMWAAEGVAYDGRRFARHFGRRAPDTVRLVLDEEGRPAAEDVVQALAERKQQLFRERIARALPVMDGALELVRGLRARGVRVAVGTSAPRRNLELTLARLGAGLFDATVTGEDVRQGKPAPDVFVETARRLGVAPELTVVIEDAPDGIRAAHAAGMRAVALLSYPRRLADFVADPPERAVHALGELTPEALDALPPRTRLDHS